MDKLTVRERTSLVRHYFTNGGSPTEALKAYGRETGNYEICSTETVEALIAKFKATGSVLDPEFDECPNKSEDEK